MKMKIGNLTKIRTGKLDANASSPDGKYPFFTCSRETLKIASYSYDCECVLVAGNGDLNVKYYNGKFDAYQRTYIIEDNSAGKLYMPYLFYYMEGYVKELRRQAIGGVIKYIKLENLTDAIIDLPDIETQKKIVSILEKIRVIINNRNVQLRKSERLIQARFIELFGDPVNNSFHLPEVALSELGELGRGISKHRPRNAPESAQKNINLKILNELKVIMPSLEKQKEFVTFVQQISVVKVSIQKSLDKLQLLFDSLIQEYFG